MAIHDRDGRSSQFNRTDGRFNSHDNTGNQVPLGDLLRRFGQDAGALVKQELALAKLELRESVKAYAGDAVRLGIAAGTALIGALALTAFVIIGLGDLLNNYWLSALIVSAALLGTAAVLLKGALAHLKRQSLAPEETKQTLIEDQRWAKQEVQEFKQHLKAR